ncbi:MAG: tetratricopeptide repeat protein [Leptolyngbyaceae cyanobacterium SM2_5_2]|nr:tetratricopeptide repeat protein [Leptolyngbyaceae cyanobacterium SM2_5_2]
MGIYGKQNSTKRLTSGRGMPPRVVILSGNKPSPRLPTGPLPVDLPDDVLGSSVVEAVHQGDHASALQLLNHLIERHPERAAYYSNRGLVNLWCGDPTAALRDFNQAIALAPNLDQAYNNRATCYAAMGCLEDALLDYDYAVELNPFNTRARINLGATLRDLGHLDEALTCFDDALLFYQLSEYSYAERGRTYHLRGDWNCALADYRRCLDVVAKLELTSSLEQLVERVQGWMHDLMPAGTEA